MTAVALSGFFGRYIYLQIPRNIQGHELSLNELQILDQKLSQLLKKKFGFTDRMVEQVEKLTASSHLKTKRTVAFIFALLMDDFTRKRAIKKFRKANPVLNRLNKRQVRAMILIARQKVILHHRIQVLNRVQQLFHYWHVIHKPFAIVMIVIMVVHIAVSVMFGYRWIF